MRTGRFWTNAGRKPATRLTEPTALLVSSSPTCLNLRFGRRIGAMSHGGIDDSRSPQNPSACQRFPRRGLRHFHRADEAMPRFGILSVVGRRPICHRPRELAVAELSCAGTRMTHADRIRKRDHVLAFATGATVCMGATVAGALAFLAYASRRGIP